MKKFLLLTLIFCAVMSTASYAQPQTQPQAQAQPMDPAVMLQQMKEKIRPEMVAKTGLTEAQMKDFIAVLKSKVGNKEAEGANEILAEVLSDRAK